MKENSTLSVGQLTVKCQVTITKSVREVLGLNPYDRVAFVLNNDGEIVLQKVKTDNLSS